MYVADVLAQNTTSPAGQAALARHRPNHPHLALNEHLSDDTWTLLWDASVAAARNDLVGIPLPGHRIDQVLATRRLPVSVLTSVLCHQRLTADQARLALTDRRLSDPIMVTRWLYSGQYPAEVMTELIARAPGEHALWELGSPHLFDQDRMIELLSSAPPGWESARYSDVVISHPNAGPAALAAARTHGSPHSYADRRERFYYAVTRPWDQAHTDREVALLGEYRDRRLPHVTQQRYAALRARSGYVTPTSRTDHDVWLAARTDIPGTDALMLSGLTSRVDKQPTFRAGRRLEQLLDDAGPGAWDVAATLLADEYPGSVADLAATAAALALTPPVPVAQGRTRPAPQSRASDGGFSR